MIELSDALDRADLARTKAGARHVLKVPAIREIADDPAMRAIASEHLGPTPAVGDHGR